MVIGGTLALVLGALSPILVSYLTKASWSPKTKQAVAIGVTLVIAAIVAFVPALGGTAVLVFGQGAGPFIDSVVAVITLVFTVQQVVFNFIFKGTEFAAKVQDTQGITDDAPDLDGDGLELGDDRSSLEDVPEDPEEGIDPELLTDEEVN